MKKSLAIVSILAYSLLANAMPTADELITNLNHRVRQREEISGRRIDNFLATKEAASHIVSALKELEFGVTGLQMTGTDTLGLQKDIRMLYDSIIKAFGMGAKLLTGTPVSASEIQGHLNSRIKFSDGETVGLSVKNVVSMLGTLLTIKYKLSQISARPLTEMQLKLVVNLQEAADQMFNDGLVIANMAELQAKFPTVLDTGNTVEYTDPEAVGDIEIWED